MNQGSEYFPLPRVLARIWAPQGSSFLIENDVLMKSSHVNSKYFPKQCLHLRGSYFACGSFRHPACQATPPRTDAAIRGAAAERCSVQPLVQINSQKLLSARLCSQFFISNLGINLDA